MIIWLILTFAGPLWMYFSGKVNFDADYRTANRDSANLAPLPEEMPDAVVQVYSARAFNWRGLIATHCWISVKPKGASSYTVYQVIGWLKYWDLPALSIEEDIPDRNWYDAKPTVLLSITGKKAEDIIPKIEQAAYNYPFAEPYVVWPGPNSNTFPAYVARAIPELVLALPSDAIGKDYLPKGTFITKAPSGTGYQFSVMGIFGLLVAKKEGIEINLLGLVYGIRFYPFRILLPGLG